jgi:hypothetical protein
MTDVLKKAVPLPFGDSPMTIERLVEMVNLLQGVTDQDQRAVRMFEFEQRLSKVEARLKAAGF